MRKKKVFYTIFAIIILIIILIIMPKLSFCFFLVLVFFSSCNNDIDSVRDNPSKVVCHQSVEEAFKNFEMVLSNHL